jgi:hypothetical protein
LFVSFGNHQPEALIQNEHWVLFADFFSDNFFLLLQSQSITQAFGSSSVKHDQLPSGRTGVECSVAFCAILERWPHNEYFLIEEINEWKYWL